MRVIPLHPGRSFQADNVRAASRPPAREVEEVVNAALSELLFGPRQRWPLPPAHDLLASVLALVEGARPKVLLPLATSPAELALLRRGEDAWVSYYAVDEPPEVRVLDRAVPLARLLAAAADAVERLAPHESEPSTRDLGLRLVERARSATLMPTRAAAEPVIETGGALERPALPLAFGFEATIVPVADPPRQGSAHSDVHALLFPGSLWLWAHGRRIPLLRGPIVLAVLRMITGVRALVEAHEAGRAANVRLRAGRFVFGVRLARTGARPVQLTFGDGGSVSVPELTVAEAALPILRLASDLLRALVAVDRTQVRNLRVRAVRAEVRALRRQLRERPRAEAVVHGDPESLRIAVDPTTERGESVPPPPRALRFETRWEADVEGLDAASTFLCGDRMIIATPRQTVCLARDDGQVLFVHETAASVAFMTGTVLVQVGIDGRVLLTEVSEGESFAEHRLAPRVGGPPSGILAGSRSAPPTAVLAEGRDRLVAIDLRTGDLRWRFRARGPGGLSLAKAGRVLVVTTEDGTVSGLDVANGELLWRYAIDGRPVGAPTVLGDALLMASTQGLFAIDVFSGRELWTRRLDATPASAPIAAGDVAAVALGGARDASLAAFDPLTGELRWMSPDPGVARGASCLRVDRLLVVNAPAGQAQAISLDDGGVRWSRRLSHPVADDVPRRLEPVLRGGALFVPAAAIHVLRPLDGTTIGDPLPSELVPDWMRVDERGWVYVAEESGRLAALAPRAHLSLVR